MENTEAAIAQPFFMTLEELLSTSAGDTEYLVEGLLPCGGLSVLGAKPKCGKSTLARQLAAAVALGRPWLGREVQQGAVLYLALEEPGAEVGRHFEQLGLCKSDPVYIHSGAVGDKRRALAALKAKLEIVPDVRLVVVDPVFKLLSVGDVSEYQQVNREMEKLLEIARNHGTHVMALHHMKKVSTEDSGDGLLGSTAIMAAVDTFIGMSMNAAGIRTISSRQRYGTPLAETQLAWNPDERQMSLGTACEEVALAAVRETRERIEDDMLRYVIEHTGATQQAILSAVRGNLGTKKQALQSMIDRKFFVQFGCGVKGDPFTYRVCEVQTEEMPQQQREPALAASIMTNDQHVLQ